MDQTNKLVVMMYSPLYGTDIVQTDLDSKNWCVFSVNAENTAPKEQASPSYGVLEKENAACLVPYNCF